MTKRRPRVYIAGPINGSGRQFENLRKAIDLGNTLMEFGCDPFVPHLNLLMSFVATRVETNVPRWQEWDDNYLSICDALIRIPGESPGSDYEEGLARKLGIPVFHSLSSLLAWTKHRFGNRSTEGEGDSDERGTVSAVQVEGHVQGPSQD